MPSENALHKAAQAWCDPRTSSKTMDPDLAVVFAEILDAEREAVIGQVNKPA